MAIRVYKPTSAGRRNASVSDFSDLTRSTPEKSLVRKNSKTGGRTRGGKPPVSPWGKGEVRTRRPKKASNKMIVRRRPSGKNRK